MGCSPPLIIFKDSAFGRDGIEVSISGAYETYRNVPDAKHDTISKLNAKVELPIMDGVTVPVSITWANHADLLTDEKEIKGLIGFTIDFESILKKKKSE